MQTVILENLSKTYPSGKQAVRQISLSLNSGEIYGFLGPNGAGKTTTVKLLTGMLTPSGGCCSVLGTDPALDPAKTHENMGVVTEHAQMYDNLTGFDNLIFYASVFGIASEEGKKRADTLLEQLGLQEAADQKLSAYSTGMRQRLSLARALIHRPKVLFLDEPTSGLDPESAQNVNEMILKLAIEDGVTVFLCTHQLRYAQEICTRFGLIDQGCLLAAGTLSQLREQVCSGIVLQIRADRLPAGLSFASAGGNYYETKLQREEEIPGMIRQKGGGFHMKRAMLAIIQKDIRSVTANRNLLASLLIVPLVLTVILPSVFLLLIHFAPEDPDVQKLVELLPQNARSTDLQTTVTMLIFNYILPVFFLMIPIITASIMAASSFVGEKERHTLETLLYCPLSVRQIFQAKVLASFFLSMLLSVLSFLAMLLVLEIESLSLMGRFLVPGISWLVILLLVSPSISLIAVTLIVRGSAKARSMEESQQSAVFLIIPVILLTVGQFSGVLLLNVWILLALGILCALLAGLLLKKCMRRFTYEMLLSSL